jgi:hypothetical protein
MMISISLEHLIPGLVVYLIHLSVNGSHWAARQADPTTETLTAHRPLPDETINTVVYLEHIYRGPTPIEALTRFLLDYLELDRQTHSKF